MAFRLEEDLLDLKEPPVCFLDLKGVKIRTEDQLQAALKRVPDLKLRKEKIVDKDVLPPTVPAPKKKGFNNVPLPTSSSVDDPFLNDGLYAFESPIPDGMRNIRLRDVAQVEIDWKMLTLDRPKTNMDEEIYSRYVEMDRLKLKTMATEAPKVLFSGKPSAATILPTIAPGNKKKKKSKKGQKGKDSDDEEDEPDMKDEGAAEEEAGADDEEDQNAATFNEKFTYEFYARFVEDKDDNEDADLADETQEAPVKEKSTKNAKSRRTSRKSRSKTHTDDSNKAKETDIKPPQIIPIKIAPPSPIPGKQGGFKKRSKTTGTSKTTKTSETKGSKSNKMADSTKSKKDSLKIKDRSRSVSPRNAKTDQNKPISSNSGTSDKKPYASSSKNKPKKKVKTKK